MLPSPRHPLPRLLKEMTLASNLHRLVEHEARHRAAQGAGQVVPPPGSPPQLPGSDQRIEPRGTNWSRSTRLSINLQHFGSSCPFLFPCGPADQTISLHEDALVLQRGKHGPRPRTLFHRWNRTTRWTWKLPIGTAQLAPTAPPRDKRGIGRWPERDSPRVCRPAKPWIRPRLARPVRLIVPLCGQSGGMTCEFREITDGIV